MSCRIEYKGKLYEQDYFINEILKSDTYLVEEVNRINASSFVGVGANMVFNSNGDNTVTVYNPNTPTTNTFTTNPAPTAIQSDILTRFQELESRIIYDPSKVDKEAGKTGYSLIDKVTGAIRDIGHRVTERIDKLNEKRKFQDRTLDEKAIDEIKRQKGVQAHNVLQNIAQRYIESLEGTISTPVNNHGLTDAMYGLLKTQFENVVKSLPQGTRFLSEFKILDPTYKTTGEAGTIDLIAITPKGRINIIDYKTIDYYGKDELPKYKEENYNVQLSRYRQILRDVYGIKDEQFGFIRAIPIKANYRYINQQFTFMGFQIGNADPLLEPDERLKPIPVRGLLDTAVELTEDERTNKLILTLVATLDKVINKTEYTREDKNRKIERIANLKRAIRDLQLAGDIKAFLAEAQFELKAIDAIGIDKLTESELYNAKKLTEFYTTLFSSGLISEAQITKYKAKLDAIIGSAGRLQSLLVEEMKKRVFDRAAESGVINVNEPIAESSLWGRLFRSVSQSNHPLIRTLYQLVMKQKDKVYSEIQSLKDKVGEAEKELKKWANDRGLTGMDIYKNLLQHDKDGKWTGNLISKFSSEFYAQRKKAWAEKNTDWFSGVAGNVWFDKAKYDADLKRNIEEWKLLYKGQPDAAQLLDKKILKFNRDFNVNDTKTGTRAMLNKSNYYIKPMQSKWLSEEYKYMLANEPLKKFYELFTETIETFDSYMDFDQYGNFIPNIDNSLLEQIYNNGLDASTGLNLKYGLEARSDESFGMIDENGKQVRRIPILYTHAIDPGIKSRDLGKSLLLFAEMGFNNKYMQEIESAALMLEDAMQTHPVLLTDAKGNARRSKLTGKIAEYAKSANNIEQFTNYMNHFLYGMKTDIKDATVEIGGTDVSAKKAFSKLMSWFSVTKLSLNLFSGIANGIGGSANGFFEGSKGRFYNNQQFGKAMLLLSGRSKKTIALMHYFDVQSDENTWKKANDLSASTVLKNFTFDKFYALQRAGDYVVENTTLLAMLQSHTIKDDKIVKANKGDESLYDKASIENGKIKIDGLTEEEFGKFRRKVKYLYSTMKGNNNQDDINQIRRTVFGQALMQFRNWIPRMADERIGNLRHTGDLDTWEEGRYRTFLTHIWDKNVLPNMVSLLASNGFLGMGKHGVDNMLDKAADKEYQSKLAKNPDLKITKEQYREVYKSNIRADMAELTAIIALLVFIMMVKGNGDDDKDPQRRVFLKLLNRNMQELTFWTNPTATQTIARTPIPILGVAVDAMDAVSHMLKEGYYRATGDKKKAEKNKVLKYYYQMFPIGSAAESVYSVAHPD